MSTTLKMATTIKSKFIMKNILILIILSGFMESIYAQTGVLTDNYDRYTIYLKKKGFEKNGQRIPYGTFKKNLKKELTASPLALEEYKRSCTNAWVATGCTIAATVLTLSGIQRIGFKKETTYSGVGLNLLAIPFKIKSQNQLNRAVWLYNRDAISQK